MESIAISAASAGGFGCFYGLLKRGMASSTAAANAGASAVHAILMIGISYRVLSNLDDMGEAKTVRFGNLGFLGRLLFLGSCIKHFAWIFYL